MSKSIKAFVFDVYGTLFDVHSVKEATETLYPGKGEAISQAWRKKQVEYSFLHQLMGTYRSFWKITKDALRYALKENEQSISSEIEEFLMEAYLHLTPFPEVHEVLLQLRNKTLAVFSNGSHDMLDPLIDHSLFGELFDDVVNVDEVKQYKPTPAAYDHALHTLKVSREEVLFISSNGWDISGAKNFGFHTAWINRNKLPIEELELYPDAIYEDLTGILEWI
ncbi:haloacid dehalogenase type II [Bacillus sp. FSL W8-0116]|uniref:haloacid dehalogenase type II n=1 Tax=Bacillus sp. FSL W8-0116 TaxID=2978206 RepID=UPI0030F50720